MNMAKSKACKLYTQEILEEAVQLVRSKRMTLYGASKSFKIPLSTLGDKVRGRRAVRPQVKMLLTDEEEEKLVQWIKVSAERSMERTHNDVRSKVKEILDLRGAAGKREDGRPCMDWVTSFKKRHPGLSLRSRHGPGKERALVQDQDVWDSLDFSEMKMHLPQTPSTSQATSAATALPQVAITTTKLDAITTFLHFSSMVGIRRCEGFLEMLKERKTSGDSEFREFQRLLVAAGVIEAQSQSIPVSFVSSSSQCLDEPCAPPQLPKNKGDTNSKKNSSMTIAFSSDQNIYFLKGEEDQARMEREMKERREKDREEAKVRKEQEKKECRKRAKVERKRKKQEKKEAKERKEVERPRNGNRKRKRIESSSGGGSMVLESDDDSV